MDPYPSLLDTHIRERLLPSRPSPPPPQGVQGPVTTGEDHTTPPDTNAGSGHTEKGGEPLTVSARLCVRSYREGRGAPYSISPSLGQVIQRREGSPLQYQPVSGSGHTEKGGEPLTVSARLWVRSDREGRGAPYSISPSLGQVIQRREGSPLQYQPVSGSGHTEKGGSPLQYQPVYGSGHTEKGGEPLTVSARLWVRSYREGREAPYSISPSLGQVIQRREGSPLQYQPVSGSGHTEKGGEPLTVSARLWVRSYREGRGAPYSISPSLGQVIQRREGSPLQYQPVSGSGHTEKGGEPLTVSARLWVSAHVLPSTSP